MTPEELLAITPEFLGKAILHRRERLASEIPEQLDARTDELSEAASMARSAKVKRDDVNKKVASLKKERNDAQAKAKKLFVEANAIRETTPMQNGDTEPEPEWAKDRLQQRLDALDLSLQTNWGTHLDERSTLNEMKNLIRKHEEWVDSRKEKFSEINRMKDLQENAKQCLATADKAHQAMVQLHDENQIFHDTYIENEQRRKRADARTTRLAQALDESQRGIRERWQGSAGSRPTKGVRKSECLFHDRTFTVATRPLAVSVQTPYGRHRCPRPFVNNRSIHQHS